MAVDQATLERLRATSRTHSPRRNIVGLIKAIEQEAQEQKEEPGNV